jgi:hydrogenase expression/formation protein HypD
VQYVTQFRDEVIASKWLNKIKLQVDMERHYRFMEFCGGHTHVIHRYGLNELLPANIEMIHGPGCPVCVLPIERIDQAIYLAKQNEVIFCTYADMMRVPGSNQDSLIKAKAKGADIKMIYSVEDALSIAKAKPNKNVIFFAIGFETTTPATAVAIKKAKAMGLSNFFVFCNHVLTPKAMHALLLYAQENELSPLDGFIGPAHVSVITGINAYEKVSQQHKKPIVISGFEPLDMLQSISMLIDLVNKDQVHIKNQYIRAVTKEGNIKAQKIIDEVMSLKEQFEWRGLGIIPRSALQIRKAFKAFDAEKQFILPQHKGKEHKACRCPDILCGALKPKECTLFGKACTPQNPLGACMVSSEGACSASFSYEVVLS